MRPSPRATALIALAAIAAVALTYFDALSIGFLLDDYFLLRVRPWTELVGVWHGTWDPTGLTPAFYRPLAAWADAGAFTVFGFDERALHLLALGELACGAWLLGEFVRREVSATWLGAFTAVLFAVHPAVSRSSGPWWFEQNHRLSVICVGAALLAWQHRRSSIVWRAWWPVHSWILIGSWFKEDVLLLAPLLLVFQWWRASTTQDVPRPSWPFVARVSTGLTLWLVTRWLLLGVVAGVPIGGPDGTVIDQLRHLARGPWQSFVRVRPMSGPVEPIHQLTTVLLVIISARGLWLARTCTPRARLLIGYGIAAGIIFNTLVAIASSPTRYHLIAIGAVLFLTGIAATSLDADDTDVRASRQPRRWITVGTSLLIVTCFALVSRRSVEAMRPCTALNLLADAQLIGWLDANPAWRDSWIPRWLDDKAARCATGTYIPMADAIPDVLRRVRERR